MSSLSEHPFVLGLAVGLLVALLLWVRALFAQRALRREMEELKQSLYTKLKIDAKAQLERENELEGLRRQNENLRITVGTLQQKAGRAEIRQLHVYDRAIHAMLGSAPGFAPAWEAVLREAEQEVGESETGVSAFVRKVFVSQSPSRRPPPKALEASNRDDDTES